MDEQTARLMHSVLEAVAVRLVAASPSDRVPRAYEDVANAIFTLEDEYPQILQKTPIVIDLDKCIEDEL